MSDKDIKAIPTIYNGTQFRSRLEAKWACFFHLCNLNYKYESEGYTMNGVNYLPDFHLPEHKIYVEVKPSVEKMREESAANKIIEFTKATNEMVIVFVDEPIKAKYYFYSKQWDSKEFTECRIFWSINSKNDSQYSPLIINESRLLPAEIFFRASNYIF